MGEKYDRSIIRKKKIYPTAEFISGKWNQEINVRDFYST